MRTPRVLAAALAAGLLLAAAGRLQAGETADCRARQLVDGQQSTIAFFLHPTATLKSLSCDGSSKQSNGDFTLDYTFRFKSWYGTSFYSKMRFRFYANGGLDSLSANGTNAVVSPFTASNLIVRWFKGRLVSNAGSSDTDQLRRLLKKADSRLLLEWWLKAAQ
jgi:hypothetical protein